jgi:hypothetical protein
MEFMLLNTQKGENFTLRFSILVYDKVGGDNDPNCVLKTRE